MKMKAFQKALLDWYGAHGRHGLPWRNSDNPYHVYVSEVMLQQTQVATVLDRYYAPFLEAFPTLEALAQAEEAAVLKAWEGLGYYTRARNLHRTAKALCAASTPAQLPNDPQELQKLAGIGRNTANAIACFGCRLPYPILEANVKRLVHRLFALRERDDKTLWAKAELLLNRANPFDHNQAMMDMGALICTPKNPRCGECPVAAHCKGKHAPLNYPAPKAAKRIPVRCKRIVVVRDAAKRYFVQRRQSRFLGGLYGFIELEADATACDIAGQRITIADMQPLGTITQTYSHFQLQAEVYLADIATRINAPEWVNLQEMQQLALSRADSKITQLLLRAFSPASAAIHTEQHSPPVQT
jgi:A/G-specific adenine glycosylase